jgi:hypothetical protein
MLCLKKYTIYKFITMSNRSRSGPYYEELVAKNRYGIRSIENKYLQ